MNLDENIDKKSFSFREISGQKSEWTPTQNPRAVSASANVNRLDDVIRADCTSGAVVMTLETAVGCDGRPHTFKKIDASANALTVAASGSETIDGAATLSSTVRYMTYVIKSNGTNWDLISAAVTSAPGTVTSIAQTFTGGLISVAGSPVTTTGTLALTVAGTSGGVPYFSSGTAWASSAALAASALVLGGGAGNPPATTTTGTGVVTALGVNVGSAGAFVTFNGALGTPSSGTLTNATGLPVGSGVSGLGTGVSTALAVNTGTVGAFLVYTTTSYTGTLTGCTTSPTITINATIIGNAIVLDLGGNFAATSNATTKTITGMPAGLRPATAHRFTVNAVKDNGGAYVSGSLVVETTGVLTLFLGIVGAWTNSGAFEMIGGCYTYTLN